MLSSSRGHGDWKDYLAHEIDLTSSDPIRVRPILGVNFHELSIEDWWKKETVFVHAGTNHSRRKIVLSAANKDGGAHVDSELEEYYEFLCAGQVSRESKQVTAVRLHFLKASQSIPRTRTCSNSTICA